MTTPTVNNYHDFIIDLLLVITTIEQGHDVDHCQAELRQTQITVERWRHLFIHLDVIENSFLVNKSLIQYFREKFEQAGDLHHSFFDQGSMLFHFPMTHFDYDYDLSRFYSLLALFSACFRVLLRHGGTDQQKFILRMDFWFLLTTNCRVWLRDNDTNTVILTDKCCPHSIPLP